MLTYIIPEIPPSNNKFIGRYKSVGISKNKKAMGRTHTVYVLPETNRAIPTFRCQNQILF